MKIIARSQAKIILWPEIQTITDEELRTVTQNNAGSSRDRDQALRQLIKEKAKYAVLSHRWYDDREEPTFQGFSSRKTKSLQGYKKLLRFCKKARNEYGCILAWADTCCIDKTSSSELDEAIRSMFRWYTNSSICITYLGDSATPADFHDETWFTRGWTLQELLAPARLKFYGKSWIPISHSSNDKQDTAILNAISRVTNIPEDDIASFVPGTQKVRERMMWASKRRTTRIEDIAYSLIGMFDVSLTIAYGEGDRAFYRLMVEVVQSCYEWDIFLFEGDSSSFHFALPQSPNSYHELPSSWSEWNRSHPLGNKWFSLSKRGLQLKLLLVAIKPVPHNTQDDHVFSVALNKTTEHPDIFEHALALVTRAVGLRVSHLTGSNPDADQFAVGIVDFNRSVHEGEGHLIGGRDYFCFLTRQRFADDKWEVVETLGPIVIHCKRNLHNQPISDVIATDMH
ncbi:hypothetical protein BS17DRAFT_779877 [Gyrodon lividus]|nr:hypothetical protein BS17DRAFT_779877 [Gyrodon lividus]